jgi:hypothetical protein
LIFLILLIIQNIINNKNNFKYINNLVKEWKKNIGSVLQDKENENHIHYNEYRNDFFLMFGKKKNYQNHIHLIPKEFSYIIKANNIHSVKLKIDKNISIINNIKIMINYYKKIKKENKFFGSFS